MHCGQVHVCQTGGVGVIVIMRNTGHHIESSHAYTEAYGEDPGKGCQLTCV